MLRAPMSPNFLCATVRTIPIWAVTQNTGGALQRVIDSATEKMVRQCPFVVSTRSHQTWRTQVCTVAIPAATIASIAAVGVPVTTMSVLIWSKTWGRLVTLARA